MLCGAVLCCARPALVELERAEQPDLDAARADADAQRVARAEVRRPLLSLRGPPCILPPRACARAQAEAATAAMAARLQESEVAAAAWRAEAERADADVAQA